MPLTVQAEYFELLIEAERAARAVDEFDMRDDLPESVNAFAELKREQRRCNLALIKFVCEYRDTLELDFAGVPGPDA